ncbi:hypothetical protein B0H10DRAFT_1941682 [Mycena sp. CBHHK59/15]|nr:hypothetical protein B0H10DRAFT_1941682 [Mycena sp. CBHHK59/15]
MAITHDISGILQAAAFWVSNKEGTNDRKLYFYFYIMLMLLSMLLGNDPVILSSTVFLVYYTRGVDLEPLPWLITEFASANTISMVLVIGNPTNMVVCEGPIEKLDIKQVIQDPVSACVGSFLLAYCVVVIMVISFFNIDVWRISLPFTVTKLIFDLVWDYIHPKAQIMEVLKSKGDRTIIGILAVRKA